MTQNPIPMVDLQLQYQRLKAGIDQAVAGVMAEGRYINGPDVRLFATELADYLGCGQVIPCANGTDALQLALMALGLQPGDEVITTSFSFFASAEVIALLGLVPVFADVNPNTYNIDCGSLQSLITAKTKCVIPVHLFGQGADMVQIMQIAERNNLYVVEDVAQALGAGYLFNSRNQKLGTIAHIGCTSFFPTKNLGCFGDGGAVMTNDVGLADKIRMLASHGSRKQYIHEVIGINSRLDTIQAAILRVKLPYLDEFIQARQMVAAHYADRLKAVSGIVLPAVDPDGEHTFNQFSIRVLNQQRDALQNYLHERGISSRVYYPLALHRQEAVKGHLNRRPSCGVAEQLCCELLSLPVYPDLAQQDVDQVIEAVITFFKQ